MPGPGVSCQIQGCVPKWEVPGQEFGHYRDTEASVALCSTHHGLQEGCTLTSCLVFLWDLGSGSLEQN